MSSNIVKALGQVDRAIADLTARERELALHLVSFVDETSDQLRTEEVMRAFQVVMSVRSRLGDESRLFVKIFLELYGGTDDKITKQANTPNNHPANRQPG